MAVAVQKNLTLENMNARLKAMEYAVKGPVVARAAEIEKEIQQEIQQVSLSLSERFSL